MRILLAVLLLAISMTSFADTLPNKSAAKDLAASVMEKVAKGEMDQGLELLRPYLAIPSPEFDVMKNQLALQAPMIKQRFGETLSFEYIGAEDVGESIMLIVYIQKFEKYAMRWKFYFYNPKDGWIINQFNTDDQIQLLFKIK